MEYRKEHDSMGEVLVPKEAYWGAQTQRSLENFRIGARKMPRELLSAFGVMKAASAEVNASLLPMRMTKEKCTAIRAATDEIGKGLLWEQFPLSVYQTGSGTQTNMNVNEVIANRGNAHAGCRLLHPNDDVNMSQSSNDTFPTAMHMAAVLTTEECLLPVLGRLIDTLFRLEEENRGIVKSGRTHLQDATPIGFDQEISGWRASLEQDAEMIRASLTPLRRLALGATAVGTGLNAPAGFDVAVCRAISEMTGREFLPAENKFHALTSKGELVFAHGALKALAADLWKIANDIRLLASGPRCGLGEITIPENEPGSSIMPGKVNPTQCEAVTMVAARVMGNDTVVGLCASQGNFELNVFMPVCIDAYLESLRLLSDVCDSFEKHCVRGIRPNREKMKENLHRSLMTVTALTPHIGYENAARVVHKAYNEGTTLREATLALGYLSAEDFDRYFKQEEII